MLVIAPSLVLRSMLVIQWGQSSPATTHFAGGIALATVVSTGLFIGGHGIGMRRIARRHTFWRDYLSPRPGGLACRGELPTRQDPQLVLSSVNRSVEAVPTAAMSVPTVVRFCPTLPLPRLPASVCNCLTDACTASTCGW